MRVRASLRVRASACACECLRGVKAFRNFFLRKTLHHYIFNFGLSKHDSSCILIFSINMDGIEKFVIEMTSN